MNNIKKISIIALVLLIVGVVGSLFTFHTLKDDSKSVEVVKVIENSSITNIKIRSNNETVKVLPTKESNAKVELSGTGTKNSEDKLTVSVDGNTLNVKTVDRHKFFDFNFFAWDSLTLIVYLPDKVYDSLNIDIDNGSFLAEQLAINNVSAETNNGRLEMNDISATIVNLGADNGKIALNNVSGEIYGETNNGIISLVTETLDRPIELETDNGKIEIQAEREPINATFIVEIDNGRADIFGSNGSTVFGNGDNIIKLSTDNGKITVK